MKMTDVDGNLQTYTTLRDVPDANLLTYLKTNFPDLLDGDQIDISNHLGASQKQLRFSLNRLTMLPTLKVSNIWWQVLIGKVLKSAFILPEQKVGLLRLD